MLPPMVTLVLALVVCLLGAVLYLAAGGKPETMGRVATLGLVCFGVGLLVTLENVSGAVTVEAHATQHSR